MGLGLWKQTHDHGLFLEASQILDYSMERIKGLVKNKDGVKKKASEWFLYSLFLIHIIKQSKTSKNVL